MSWNLGREFGDLALPQVPRAPHGGRGGHVRPAWVCPCPPRPPAGLPPSSLPLDHMFFQASWGTDDQADKLLSRGQGCLQKARDKAERQCRACGFPAAGRGGPHGQRGRDSRGPTPPGLTLCQAWCQPPLGDKVNPSLLPATTPRGQRKDQSWYFLLRAHGVRKLLPLSTRCPGSRCFSPLAHLICPQPYNVVYHLYFSDEETKAQRG